MMNFNSDYMRGCHPEILERLQRTNLEATTGYGSDPYTTETKARIADACKLNPDKYMVELLVGGTQTNAVVIGALLRSFQGVIAAESAHINVHEAGAIEAGGHKIIVLSSQQGKLRADDVAAYIDSFYADETYPHMVAPGMVYISHPTELGTLYSLAELEALSSACRQSNIKLYLDGARLAYGLEAENTDVTLPDIARLADVFYIGGTKCGTLFGEAVATADKSLLPHFTTIVKQHGALLAKGRLAGIQFATLFSNGLYSRIGRNGISTAMSLRRIFTEAGYDLFIDSPTNQQFIILPNKTINYFMNHNVGFELWGPMLPEATPVRFVTDWATTEESIEELKRLILSQRTSS